jgi:hypothetical protein
VPTSIPGEPLGIAEAPVAAGVAGAADPAAGREAISTPLAGKPVKVEVPPGRYWPAGAAMRTVAAVEGVAEAGLAIEVVACAALVVRAGALPYLSASAGAAAAGALATGVVAAAGNAVELAE